MCIYIIKILFFSFYFFSFVLLICFVLMCSTILFLMSVTHVSLAASARCYTLAMT